MEGKDASCDCVIGKKLNNEITAQYYMSEDPTFKFNKLYFSDFRCAHPFCCSEITYSIRDSYQITNAPPTLADLDLNRNADFYDPLDSSFHPFKNNVAPYTYNHL